MYNYIAIFEAATTAHPKIAFKLSKLIKHLQLITQKPEPVENPNTFYKISYHRTTKNYHHIIKVYKTPEKYYWKTNIQINETIERQKVTVRSN